MRNTGNGAGLRGSCQGFSLLEILSGIAILMILAAALIPLISKMMEKGQQSSCLHAMQQIMLAENLYSTDNDGYLAPYQIHYRDEGGDLTGYANWPSLLAPYVLSGRDFENAKNEWIRCPAQKEKDSGDFVISGIGPVYTNGNNGHMVHGGGVPDGLGRVSAKRIAVSRPALTPSWMDVSGGSSSGYPAYCRGCYPGGVGLMGISSLHILEANNFGTRHKGTSNVGFVDGHVELVPLDTLQKPPMAGQEDFFQHYTNN